MFHPSYNVCWSGPTCRLDLHICGLQSVLKDGMPLVTEAAGAAKHIGPQDVQALYDSLLEAGFRGTQAQAALEVSA